ncbi:hypothetical protein CK934_08225 [Chitinophaga sp. MD30]|nr:hypothetical protein CK934_08225 [Chitinophaga sp. MD30]
MKRMQYFLITLATVHLAVVALHAAHIREWNVRPAWLPKILAAYGDYTGAGNIFSFFAPQIGEETTVLYTVVDPLGNQEVCQLQTANAECDRRVQTIYNFFNITEARDLLAQSCASYMLRQHPQGQWIRVTVVSHEIPTMSAFNNGARPKWVPIFIKDMKKRTCNDTPLTLNLEP